MATRRSYTYDYSTQNKDFIKMHFFLKELGIKNNKFFLILYDETLKGVDPYDPNLSIDMQRRIILESRRNDWYFYREVYRITKGVPEPIRYGLHLGNLAFHFLRLYNSNIYLELPRQCWKSDSVVADHVRLCLFDTLNSTFGLFNYNNLMVAENVTKIMDGLNSLPVYMRFHEINIKDTGEKDEEGNPIMEYTTKPKSSSKKMSINIDATGNRIIGKTPGTTSHQAEEAGRGLTTSNQWWDEPMAMRFLKIAIDAAHPAFNTAKGIAQKHGLRYGKIFTSTPPDIDTPTGEYMLDFFKNQSCLFRIAFFDKGKELDDILRKNSKNGIFFISYQWYELGQTIEWYEGQVQNTSKEKLRRDILLIWEKQITDNPYDMDQLRDAEILTARQAYKDVEVGKNYFMRIYHNEKENWSPDDVLEYMQNNPIILSSDVSAGMGGNRDSTTLTGICPITSDLLFDLESNEMNPTDFSTLLKDDFIYGYTPKALICMERNSYGRTVLTNLMVDRKIAKHNIVYFPMSDNMELQKIKKDDPRGIAGVYNVSKIRDTLFKFILTNRLAEHRLLFRSKRIVDQMMGLVEKNDRIDHKPGRHDDILIAYLIGIYVLVLEYNILQNHCKELEPKKIMKDTLLDELSYQEKTTVYNILNRIRHGLDYGEDDSSPETFIDEDTILLPEEEEYYREIEEENSGINKKILSHFGTPEKTSIVKKAANKISKKALSYFK